MYNVRRASGFPLSMLSKICGYSEPSLRKMENFDIRKGAPIPAYVMASYAKACDAPLEDLCSSWLSEKKEEQPQKEKHAKKPKYISVAEIDILQKMRSYGRIGSERPTNLLDSLSKSDLELIYCLQQITYGTSRGEDIVDCIRRYIYDLYMTISEDEDFCDEITKDLVRGPYNHRDRTDLMLE